MVRDLVGLLIFGVTVVSAPLLQCCHTSASLRLQLLPKLPVQYLRSPGRFPAFFDPAREPFAQPLKGLLALRAQPHFGTSSGNPLQGFDVFRNACGAFRTKVQSPLPRRKNQNSWNHRSHRPIAYTWSRRLSPVLVTPCPTVGARVMAAPRGVIPSLSEKGYARSVASGVFGSRF